MSCLAGTPWAGCIVRRGAYYDNWNYYWIYGNHYEIWTNEPRLMLLALLSATLAFVATIVTPSKKRVMAAAVAFAICAALEIAALARFQHPEYQAQLLVLYTGYI